MSGGQGIGGRLRATITVDDCGSPRRRPEGLRHVPPGELGKAVGLDRVPEVRTLREKIARLAEAGQPGKWMRELSRQWMETDPGEAGYLYVDGHVRVYHGTDAHLPRRYVSRERLCLRGTTDYWVNDALGRPFFVVSQAVTDGLAAALVDEIVPELLASVPGQPPEAELAADPLLHRFVVVFDREGATHSLLSRLWKQRIGVITYRKAVNDTRRRIRKLHAELGAQTLREDGGEIERQAERLQDIQALEAVAADLRLKRRQTPKKVALDTLPADQRPSQLRPLGKLFTDTVKMIAFRHPETGMRMVYELA